MKITIEINGQRPEAHRTRTTCEAGHPCSPHQPCVLCVVDARRSVDNRIKEIRNAPV